jgi:hypothetical protein
MKKLLLLILMIISCYGCKKDNSFNYSSSLTGKWSWLRSCGGFAGCVGPEIEHVTINVVFSSDSIYNYYQNDTLKYSTRFSTYKLLSKEGKDSVNFIKYDSGGSMNYSIFHDTLGISNYIFSSIYKRIK